MTSDQDEWERFCRWIEVAAHLSQVEWYEAAILFGGGCTAEDAEWAVERWRRAYRVNDDWPWLRSVILRRAADRMELVSRGPAADEAP